MNKHLRVVVNHSPYTVIIGIENVDLKKNDKG